MATPRQKAGAKAAPSGTLTPAQQQLIQALTSGGTSGTQLGIIGMPGTVTSDRQTYSPNAPSHSVTSLTPDAAYLPMDTPFGVPSTTTIQHPQYAEGDEWKPQTDLSAAQIRDLQTNMIALHLYPSGSVVHYGTWGPDDAAAYKGVLAGANGAFTDAGSYIQKLNDTQAAGGTTTVRAPLVVHLTNSDDIRSVAKDAVSKLYGGGDLNEDTVKAITDAVHQQEQVAQQNEYNMSATGGSGGSVEQPASVSTTAEKMLQERNPDQVTVTRFGTAMDDIMNTLINGPIGSSNFR